MPPRWRCARDTTWSRPPATSWMATWPSCCPRWSITAVRPPGRGRCGPAACGSDSSVSPRRNCPHWIQATYRTRSVANILDELSYLEDTRGPLHIVFRDPLFSQERDRVLELCDGIRSRELSHTFECETRLDRLDGELVTTMHRAGLRAMSFGVESVAPATLKKVGRRPIPEAHQREILRRAREPGI